MSSPSPTPDKLYKPITAKTLSERQQQALRTYLSVRFKGVVSHTTALDLFRVERPERLLNDHQLHITVSKRHLRRQQFGPDSPDIAMHQWKDLTAEHAIMLSAGLRVLSPEATWGLLAPGLRIDELTEVAESLIRHGHATEASLEEFLTSQRFPGKAKCRASLALVVTGSDSPKETQLRLCLYSYGLDRFEVNYRVPDILSDQGGDITLDLADCELKIGIEYAGDQHRTEQRQWRRDLQKHRLLESMGWMILQVTQLDLANPINRERLAMRIASARAQRAGHPLMLSTQIPWEMLADRRRHSLR